MSVARAIFTKLGFQVDASGLVRFNEKIGRTKKEMTVAARSVRDGKKEFNALAFAVKAAVAAFVGSRIIRAVTTDFTNNAAEAGRMSEALGVSVEFYSRLEHVLGTVGIQGEETSQVIADISERMFDAAGESKALAGDFAKIGLTEAKLKALAKAGPEAQLLGLADALHKAGPGAERTFVAMSGLGDVGKKLLPILGKGSEGIKRMFRDADRLGVVLDKKTVKQAMAFNAAMVEFKAALKGIQRQIATALLPAVSKIIKLFSGWAGSSDNVTAALARLKQMMVLLTPIFIAWAAFKLKAKFLLLAAAVGKLVFALKTLGAAGALASAKIALIPLAILAIVLAVEDFIGFVQGKDSIFGRLLGDEAQDVAGQIRSAIGELASAFNELAEEFQPLFDDLWSAAGPALKALKDAIEPLIPSLGSIVKLMLKAFVWVLIIAVRLLTLVMRLLTNIIADAVKPLAHWLGDVIMWILNGILTHVTNIGKIFRDLWVGSIEAVQAELTDLGDMFVWLFGLAAMVAKAIKNVFIKAWDAIAKAFPGPAAFIKKVWNGIVSAAKTVWTKVKGFASGAASTAKAVWATVSGAISSAFKTASGTARKAWAAVKSLFGKRVEIEFANLDSDPELVKKKAEIERLKSTLDSNRRQVARFGAQAAPPAAGEPGGPALRTISVGEVKVEVTGSVDMSGPDFQQRVRQGARDALQQVVSEAAKDRTPATST